MEKGIPKVEWHKVKKRPGILYLESVYGKTYYVRYRHRGGYCPDGKRCTGHFERTDADTQAAAASIREDKIRGKVPTNEARRESERAAKEAERGRWTFNRLWEAWQADPENAGKRGTKKAAQRYKKHIKEPLGKREPKDIKPLDIDRLRLSLAEGHSRETTISIIGLIRRLERYGASRGLCPGLPFPVILRGKKLGRDRKAKRIPNDAEMAAYIEAANAWPDPQAGNFQLFIVYTGVRRGSAQNLKWEDVDLENGTAILRDSKTGDVQIVLSSDALALLEVHPRTPGNPFVFTSGKGPRTQRQIDRIPRKIADAARWPKDLDPCHSFRRNLATRLGREGISPSTIMRLGGWKSPAMVTTYTKTDTETIRDAANLLGRTIAESAQNGKGA
jgi:integrase